MGLIAIPFAVDIEKVKKVFGSKDPELLRKIKTAALYDNYASQSEDFSNSEYRYNFDQALEDIIFHYVKPEARKRGNNFLGFLNSKPTSGLNKNFAHGYGYVLLVICDYLGTHLLPHCDGFYYGRDFESAVAIMKEKGLQLDLGDMFEQHEVFDIPKNNDLPAIKLFTRKEIEHVNTVLRSVEIDERKTDYHSDVFDEVEEMLMYIRNSFQTCGEQNLDMITFTH